MNPIQSVFLNFSRWFAAFLVVLGHAAHFLLAELSTVSSPGIVVRFLYLLTSLGHCAVMIFFVISGYLVGGITLDRWLKKGTGLVDYSISRFSRIYTVLLPALLIGYVVDWIGLHWFNQSGLYSNLGRYPIGSLDSVGPRLGIVTFIGNVLMLEGTAVTSLGSNGPLWSLAYEWWYYCIFAFVAAGLLMSGRQRWVLLACVPILALVLPARMLLWMTIWILGAGLYFVCQKMQRKPHPLVGTGVFIAAVVIFYATRTTDNLHPETMWYAFVRDFFVGVAYSFALLSFSGAKGELPWRQMHDRLAAFSYSMYLFHFPVLLLIIACAERYWGWQLLSAPSLGVVGRIVAVTCVLYALGYIFSQISERHTDAVKDILKRHASKVGINVSRPLRRA